MKSATRIEAGSAMFLMLLLASGCGSRPAPASSGSSSASPSAQSPAPSGRVVLGTVPAAGGAFEVSVAPCTSNGCAIDVRWMEKALPVASFTEPIRATTQTTRREPVDVLWGADPGLQAWASGTESDYVAIAARPVQLDASTVGLLVTQRFGFDHLKRGHRLLVRRGGQLSAVWEMDEAPGATWSATEVIAPAAGGPAQIALSDGRFAAESSNADRLTVSLLAWDASAATLLPVTPTGASVTALLVGTSDSVAHVRARRTANLSCLQSLWVLGPESVSAIGAGRAGLGMVFASRAHAEDEGRRLASCGVDKPTSIVDVRIAAIRK